LGNPQGKLSAIKLTTLRILPGGRFDFVQMIHLLLLPLFAGVSRQRRFDVPLGIELVISCIKNADLAQNGMT
jgi:hypothetical protein